MYAAMDGYKDIVQLLAVLGADVNRADYNYNSYTGA